MARNSLSHAPTDTFPTSTTSAPAHHHTVCSRKAEALFKSIKWYLMYMKSSLQPWNAMTCTWQISLFFFFLSDWKNELLAIYRQDSWPVMLLGDPISYVNPFFLVLLHSGFSIMLLYSGKGKALLRVSSVSVSKPNIQLIGCIWVSVSSSRGLTSGLTQSLKERRSDALLPHHRQN